MQTNELIGETIERVFTIYEEHGDTTELWMLLETMLTKHPELSEDVIEIMGIETNNEEN